MAGLSGLQSWQVRHAPSIVGPNRKPTLHGIAKSEADTLQVHSRLFDQKRSVRIDGAEIIENVRGQLVLEVPELVTQPEFVAEAERDWPGSQFQINEQA